MAKKFKERKREMLVERKEYWEISDILSDLGIEYRCRVTVDSDFSVLEFNVTLPAFMTIEKILKAKKIQYRMFRWRD